MAQVALALFVAFLITRLLWGVAMTIRSLALNDRRVAASQKHSSERT